MHQSQHFYDVSIYIGVVAANPRNFRQQVFQL